MKKILFGILATLLGLSITAFAKDGVTINGSANLNNAEYDSLEVNGALKFKDLLIKDFIVVNGSFKGKNLKCHKITSNGAADVEGLQAQNVESNGAFSGQNIDVAGDAEFNGGVEIKNGKLHNILITSTNSTIIDTQVNGNIRIKKANNGWSFLGFDSKEPSAQILELKGRTIVSGDIIFEADGEAHLFGGAKIQGKVIKAKVVRK